MALFNNGYPVNYPYYAPQQQQQNNSSVIWVQGEAGAKSYLVAPNTTIALFDSEAQTIYLKSADASGMPSIKTLDYTIREMPVQAKHQGIEYATKADIEDLRQKIAELKKGSEE